MGRAVLEDVRLHDLRHTVGTYAAQAGANAFLVRDKLGYKTLAVTGRYVGRAADPLRVLSDTVEGRIAAALDGKPGEVFPLDARRKKGAVRATPLRIYMQNAVRTRPPVRQPLKSVA